ncbi:carboxypeptidase regulatory-like domain-containing protein, partial [Candidatus Bipolaricaulota bacterium]|nr:carboxypeptidase regulatory-like domain-containing protein [Candidatus Bipolaricaulota bacterium]
MRRMGSIGLLVGLLLFVPFSNSYTTQQAKPGDDPSNLLINAGFESGDEGRPLGWRFVELPGGEGTIDSAWDDANAYRGERSLRIDIEGTKRGIWSQTVPIETGAVYEISGYVAFENLAPRSDAHLQIVFRDTSGRLLEFVNLARHNTGTRGFELDFPARMVVRAPNDAASAEVNGYLEGSGTLWIDDVSFSPAPVGSLRGRVISAGAPVLGTRVFIWGDPWGQVIEAFTDANGSYELTGIPVSHPRYIVIAEKDGFRTLPAGDVIVVRDQAIELDFELVEGNDPTDTLEVGYGFIAQSHVQEIIDLPDSALRPNGPIDYSESIQPYLGADEYVTSDDPIIQALAADILASVSPADRNNSVAVAWAVYAWISTTINHDAVYGNHQPYLDVTSGIWQTIQPGGWCWGSSFYDWLYQPAKLLAEKTGICIEHSWLSAALLRALNIPARARVGSAQFWLDTGGDAGTWFGFSTNSGSNTYRETGVLGTGFGGSALPAFFSATSEPFLHEDWNWNNPGLWREHHPWGEVYQATSSGLAQAIRDLEAYADSGVAAEGTGRRSPGEGVYEIGYSQIELGLWNLGEQRTIDVRFPAPTESAGTSDTGEWRYWT